MDRVDFRPIEIDQQWRVPLFWSRVEVTKPDQCWPWRGRKDAAGYGLFTTGGVGHMAHRVAYFIAFSKDPESMQVCHECDNPTCCNPGHFFLGTIADNMADRTAKGRTASGEGNGNCRLTEVKVYQLRSLYESGFYGVTQLGNLFGISRYTARRIIQRKAWKHI